MKTRWSILALAAMAFASPCPAPFVGDFPGTEALALDADAIVLAEVGEWCLSEEDRRKLEKASPWTQANGGWIGVPCTAIMHSRGLSLSGHHDAGEGSR